MTEWRLVRSCSLGPECNCCIQLASALFTLGVPAVTTFYWMGEGEEQTIGHRLYIHKDQVETAWETMTEPLKLLYPFNEWGSSDAS